MRQDFLQEVNLNLLIIFVKISAGSSSGSAVALCADLTPVALGTETTGSCIYPASVCGVYGMKLGHKTAPSEGIFSISDSYDAIGPMVKDPRDLVDLVEALEGKPHAAANLEQVQDGKEFEGFSIGVVSSTWEVHESIVKGKWGDDDVVSLANACEPATFANEYSDCNLRGRS